MIKLDYKISGPRWATITISDDVSSFTFQESRIFSDPLATLAQAVIDLLRSPRYERPVSITLRWIVLPEEYRWLFTVEGNDLHIRIVWFDTLSNKLDEAGEIQFATRCILLKFAIQVKTEMCELWEELGPDGYRDQTTWHAYKNINGPPVYQESREFPLEELQTLSALIREEQKKEKAERKPGPTHK